VIYFDYGVCCLVVVFVGVCFLGFVCYFGFSGFGVSTVDLWLFCAVGLFSLFFGF